MLTHFKRKYFYLHVFEFRKHVFSKLGSVRCYKEYYVPQFSFFRIQTYRLTLLSVVSSNLKFNVHNIMPRIYFYLIILQFLLKIFWFLRIFCCCASTITFNKIDKVSEVFVSEKYVWHLCITRTSDCVRCVVIHIAQHDIHTLSITYTLHTR